MYYVKIMKHVTGRIKRFLVPSPQFSGSSTDNAVVFKDVLIIVIIFNKQFRIISEENTYWNASVHLCAI